MRSRPCLNLRSASSIAFRRPFSPRVSKTGQALSKADPKAWSSGRVSSATATIRSDGKMWSPGPMCLLKRTEVRSAPVVSTARRSLLDCVAVRRPNGSKAGTRVGPEEVAFHGIPKPKRFRKGTQNLSPLHTLGGDWEGRTGGSRAPAKPLI